MATLNIWARLYELLANRPKCQCDKPICIFARSTNDGKCQNEPDMLDMLCPYCRNNQTLPHCHKCIPASEYLN